MRHSLLNEEDIAKKATAWLREKVYASNTSIYLIAPIVQCTSNYNITCSNICDCLMYACAWREQDID